MNDSSITRREQNGSLPVMQLPNELLCTIFSHLVSYLVSTHIERDRSNLLAFSYVCYHWRMIALETPSLWATPHFRFPSLAMEMLKRSGSTPLQIIARERRAAEKVTPVLRGLIHRTASIQIVTTRQYIMQRLLSKMDHSAPVLRTLDLTLSGIFTSPPLFRLPVDFLGNSTPSLTRISLANCYIPWSLKIYRNLTSLKLSYCSKLVPITSGLAIKQFLDILRNCPDLEDLHLNQCFPTSLQGVDVCPVSLPRLRCLTLYEPEMVMCLDVLTHMELSRSDVVFDIGHELLQASLLDVQDRLDVHEIRPRLKQTLALTVYRNSRPFSLCINDICAEWKLWSKGQSLEDDCSVYRIIGRLEHFMPDLLELAPLTGLKSFSLENVSVKLSATTILQHLGSLPNLHHVTWKGEFSTLPFISALAIRSKVSDVQSAGPRNRDSDMAFPSLTSIKLQSTFFPSNIGFDHPGVGLADLLVQTLGIRRDHGLGVQKVELVRPDGFHPHDLENLEKVVPVVEFAQAPSA
ncbi:hypothetical protein L218DRAFT_963902 [Marasmius fiardii PR-910]|nr:hypothetical protein L218DRAFT_963902 [Marasmius fiardii PR-910]